MIITKRCLTNIAIDRPLTYEVLVMFLAEIEATLNSRPMNVSVFNPNHFILGKQLLYFSPDSIKGNHVTCRTCWQSIQALTKMVWRYFMREHLRMLPIRKKWNKV